MEFWFRETEWQIALATPHGRALHFAFPLFMPIFELRLIEKVLSRNPTSDAQTPGRRKNAAVVPVFINYLQENRLE